MEKIRDWFWNLLFLDFYLDNSWTLRFKILNLISGDALRTYICAIHSELIRFDHYEEMGNIKAAALFAKRAKHWSDGAWGFCRSKKKGVTVWQRK